MSENRRLSILDTLNRTGDIPLSPADPYVENLFKGLKVHERVFGPKQINSILEQKDLKYLERVLDPMHSDFPFPLDMVKNTTAVRLYGCTAVRKALFEGLCPRG